MKTKLTALLAGTAGFGLAIMLGQGVAKTDDDSARIERIKRLANGSAEDRFNYYQDIVNSQREQAYQESLKHQIVMCAAPKDGFVVAVSSTGVTLLIDSNGACRELTRVTTAGKTDTVNLRRLPENLSMYDSFLESMFKEFDAMSSPKK